MSPSDSTPIRFHIHQAELALENNPLIAKRHAIQAVMLARQSPGHDLLDEALIALGNVYLKLQLEDSTLLVYEEAANILHQQGEDRRVALLQYNIGTLYFQQGVYLYSIPNYEGALQYYQHINDSLQIAETLLFLGDAYRLSGYNHKAMLNIHRALHYYQAWQDSARMASCMSVLGTVHLQLGQPQKALEYYQQVYVTREQIQDIEGMVNTLILMSKVMPDYETKKISEEKLLEALELSQYNNLPFLEAFVHDNLAKMYAGQKVFDKAIMHYQHSLTIRSQPSRLRANLAHTHIELAQIYLRKNKLDEAAKHLALAKAKLGVSSIADRLSDETPIISVEVYLQWLTASGDYWQAAAKNKKDLAEALTYYHTAINFILQEYIPNTYLYATKLVQLKTHYALFEKGLNLVHTLYQQNNNPYYLQQAYELMSLSKAMFRFK